MVLHESNSANITVFDRDVNNFIGIPATELWLEHEKGMNMNVDEPANLPVRLGCFIVDLSDVEDNLTKPIKLRTTPVIDLEGRHLTFSDESISPSIPTPSSIKRLNAEASDELIGHEEVGFGGRDEENGETKKGKRGVGEGIGREKKEIRFPVRISPESMVEGDVEDNLTKPNKLRTTPVIDLEGRHLTFSDESISPSIPTPSSIKRLNVEASDECPSSNDTSIELTKPMKKIKIEKN
ncbi:uncharacterized protein G2W53_032979 [Senna tora]|uniref:Uncharacterized protein n=1 Tax=Senna tora TaxID=362788 RepID=A0A834SWV4_9FABA|nr:uncharacterized protein G2W53_032979 [Senna tora]